MKIVKDVNKLKMSNIIDCLIWFRKLLTLKQKIRCKISFENSVWLIKIKNKNINQQNF